MFENLITAWNLIHKLSAAAHSLRMNWLLMKGMEAVRLSYLYPGQAMCNRSGYVIFNFDYLGKTIAVQQFKCDFIKMLAILCSWEAWKKEETIVTRLLHDSTWLWDLALVVLLHMYPTSTLEIGLEILLYLCVVQSRYPVLL